MTGRAEIVYRGWFLALPFVLTGPVVFWLLFAPTQMKAWSWSGLLNLYEVAAPMILMSVVAHVFAFFIVGLPFFFIFWARESVVWRFPFFVLLGLVLGAVTGLPEYFKGGYLSAELFFVCSGYGAVTAIGCWAANRRSDGLRKLKIESYQRYGK